MNNHKKNIKIFYSWQSDSPKKTNLNAIRNALKNACKQLEKEDPSLKLLPDEATRNTSGSPNIASKVLEKIEGSSIFIADVTTITASSETRACPNPNVTYELGYAVATLGWDRIILLFNEAIGQFPNDLPFDFSQHRANPFTYADSDQVSKKNVLDSSLKTAIKAILEKNPKLPAELKGISREMVQHQRDVENMRWLMEAIHIPTLQSQIDELPRVITKDALWFFDNFSGIATNDLFSVYDRSLHDAVYKLHKGWSESLDHCGQYHHSGGNHHIFTNPGDAPLGCREQKIWDRINLARKDMSAALQTILNRLRSDYMEIDIHKTSEKAWKEYVDFYSELGNC